MDFIPTVNVSAISKPIPQVATENTYPQFPDATRRRLRLRIGDRLGLTFIMGRHGRFAILSLANRNTPQRLTMRRYEASRPGQRRRELQAAIPPDTVLHDCQLTVLDLGQSNVRITLNPLNSQRPAAIRAVSMPDGE